jgi:NAD(P)-dependent dehydrogenase (short-subunit alcohol dehydrogenase family)
MEKPRVETNRFPVHHERDGSGERGHSVSERNPGTMTPNEEWGLLGKAAIVTGGGAQGDGIGNGRAACILLARAGAHVLVVDRDLTLAERTVAMIEAEGGSVAAAAYDVTVSSQCAAMVADAVARWGRLDCLDNNVGIGSKGSVVEETEENWARVMHVNVDTMFLACKHAIPAMIRTAGGGSIVTISSISALRPRGSPPIAYPKAR